MQELGIHYLRYGPPLHRTLLGPGRYDWEFADLTFADLKRRNIVPIVDLCHFGVPDWLGDFQNPDFPGHFADYARAFARRFPWVQLYTPINEMYICATFSARYGWWNEQLTDRPALRHRAQAHRQGQRAGDARDPRGAARRDLRPERVVRVFPRREPGGDQAGRDLQLEALPVARPQLRPARRLRDVRVPARQRHDARGVPLLPRQPPEAALHHGQRLLRDQRAPRRGRRLDALRGRDLRLRRDHPPVLRPLPPAGDAHRDQLRTRGRTATRR